MRSKEDFPRIIDAPSNCSQHWPFETIDHGEHVLAPITGFGKTPAVIPAVRKYGKRNGKKFAIKIEGDFVNIWRIY